MSSPNALESSLEMGVPGETGWTDSEDGFSLRGDEVRRGKPVCRKFAAVVATCHLLTFAIVGVVVGAQHFGSEAHGSTSTQVAADVWRRSTLTEELGNASTSFAVVPPKLAPQQPSVSIVSTTAAVWTIPSAAPLADSKGVLPSMDHARTATNARRTPKSARNPLRPQEALHDGNVCDDSEELYAGLCYRKCSLLTKGTHPHRSTAFSCCAAEDCGLNVFNLRTASIIPCEGYDISSSDHNTACPHFPGSCLTDEELFMGQCYEKCSMLTDGQFPNRVAAATCCNTQGVRCLDPFNDKTQASFLVGGGSGDHDAATPHGPHGPLQSMTEA